MAKHVQTEDEIDYEPALRMPRQDVILKVCDKIKAIADLMHKTRKSMEFSMWLRETETLLLHAFGPKSRQLHDFKAISYYLLSFLLALMVIIVIPIIRASTCPACKLRVNVSWRL